MGQRHGEQQGKDKADLGPGTLPDPDLSDTDMELDTDVDIDDVDEGSPRRVGGGGQSAAPAVPRQAVPEGEDVGPWGDAESDDDEPEPVRVRSDGEAPPQGGRRQ